MERATAPAKILIVDDESAIREMVAMALTQAGFVCIKAADAMEAQRCIAREVPDLILLDWMLPGIHGLDLARRLRRSELTRHIPILMLSARAEEGDRVQGLETGVDQYLTKPFSPRELIARACALLRRSEPATLDAQLEIGDLRLDPIARRVEVRERTVHVGPTEFRLLQYLMMHAERVHSRSELLDAVWGECADIDVRTVDVYIRRLRRALAPTGCHRLVQTVRGAGYRLSVKP